MSKVEIENEYYFWMEAVRDYTLFARSAAMQPNNARRDALKYIDKLFAAEANAIGWASR